MLLDLGLPGISGLEVCKRVRAQSNLPIIVLSVKDASAIKCWPWTWERTTMFPSHLAWMKYWPVFVSPYAIRHKCRPDKPSFTAGPLKVDFAQRLVQVNGQEVKLTPTEYDLLKALILNRGKIMTRHMLLAQVWGVGYGTESALLACVYRSIAAQNRTRPSASPFYPHYFRGRVPFQQ